MKRSLTAFNPTAPTVDPGNLFSRYRYHTVINAPNGSPLLATATGIENDKGKGGPHL